MREILFRGRRACDGAWVFGFFDKSDKICRIRGTKTEKRVEVRPGTVGEYTGIKDKHGVMIFEGDIVIIDSEGDDEEFKVEWDDSSARFVMIGDSAQVDFDNYWGREIEVIREGIKNAD
jgi:hypothetical protein